MIVPRAVLLVISLAHAFPGLANQPQAICTTAEDCRAQTQTAMDEKQFERAHDLAWLAYQKAPRNHAETMVLLARAQSLSGRGDDAFVMLRRLAEAGGLTGGLVTEVIEHDHFARARAHREWPQLSAMITAPRPNSAAAVSTSAKPDSPNARAPSASAAPVAPRAPSAPGPADKSASAPEASAAAKSATASVRDLKLPVGIRRPSAMAYDEVSARFVIASESTDALTVLSETSSNAAAFTSRGWSGGETTTAVAIDRAAGDLWVASQRAAGATLHRLQLISGRRLEALEVPGDEAARLDALAITRDGVFALDVVGRRLFRRAPQGKNLELWATLADDRTPTTLTYSRNALYVAHDAGVTRVELGSKRQRTVAGDDDGVLANFESLAWHDNVLIGIRTDDTEMTVVRARLNTAGTSVTSVERIGPAATAAATLAGNTYYYVAPDGDGGSVVVRAIAVK